MISILAVCDTAYLPIYKRCLLIQDICVVHIHAVKGTFLLEK